MTDRNQNIIQELVSIVGAANVLHGANLKELATSYWNSDPLRAVALVKPGSTAEVSQVLALCSQNLQPVTIKSGGTGVVEGADPAPNEVVISLARLNQIIEVDEQELVAIVEAGVVLQTLQETLAGQNLLFPLDLGARGSCMIGGNVATNAGGINVLRYGMMRNLVLGMEVVQMDGTVLSNMYPMLKNNTGYDLKQLFIGSEGTLGVVTKVLLRLFPLPTSCQTALVALNDFSAVSELLREMRANLSGTLSAFEVMWNNYFADVTGPGGHRSPISREYPFYVVIEAEGFDRSADAARFQELLERAMASGEVLDAVIASSERERKEIWQIREEFEPLLPAYLYDVSLPIKHMDAYAEVIEERLGREYPQGKAWLFGHIADGNLHIFIGPFQSDEHGKEIDRIVYESLTDFSGSVSAEHGIGIKKKPWMKLNRTDDEVQLMCAIKKVLDPNNLLNPGKIV